MPSEIVTFLFTDIEGSTRRWEDDPDAMRSALEAHDQVLRAAITGCGGSLFKHTGDGACAVFSSPKGAVEAAVAAQRALELPESQGLPAAADAADNPNVRSQALLAYGFANTEANPTEAYAALVDGLTTARDSGNRQQESHQSLILSRLAASYRRPDGGVRIPSGVAAQLLRLRQPLLDAQPARQSSPHSSIDRGSTTRPRRYGIRSQPTHGHRIP
jgi:hypothetical protein